MSAGIPAEALQLRSLVRADQTLELFLEMVPVSEPGPDEVATTRLSDAPGPAVADDRPLRRAAPARPARRRMTSARVPRASGCRKFG
jgi:hypothetical protein